MSGKLAFVMDIGGTRTKYGLVDLERRELIAYSVAATETSNLTTFLLTTNVVLDRLCEQVQPGRQEITMGGIGVPGYVDGDTISMVWPSLSFLEGQIFRAQMEATLGFPVRLENDARVVALGEAYFGKHGTTNRLLSLTLGTGLGFGMVIAGTLLEKSSINHMAGHIPLRIGARSCFCGFSGCLESVVSASALEDFFAARSGPTGQTKASVQTIFAMANDGDPLANLVIDQWLIDLTIGMNAYIQLYAPDTIVLGGGLSKQLTANHLATIQKGLFASPYAGYTVTVTTSHLQEYAGLYGAASLWIE